MDKPNRSGRPAQPELDRISALISHDLDFSGWPDETSECWFGPPRVHFGGRATKTPRCLFTLFLREVGVLSWPAGTLMGLQSEVGVLSWPEGSGSPAASDGSPAASGETEPPAASHRPTITALRHELFEEFDTQDRDPSSMHPSWVVSQLCATPACVNPHHHRLKLRYNRDGIKMLPDIQLQADIDATPADSDEDDAIWWIESDATRSSFSPQQLHDSCPAIPLEAFEAAILTRLKNDRSCP